MQAYSPATFADAQAAPEEHLLGRFQRHFEVVNADTPQRIRRALAIRYQVYCVENPFEDPAAHPDGLESDEFDEHSVHALLLKRSTGTPVGTVRLVLPDPERLDESFSIQHLVDASLLRSSGFPLQSTAEVSRFSISKQFRRRKDDTLYAQDEDASESPDPRDAPLMRLGLIQALVRLSAQHHVTHWCAVMEPTLLRMLAAMGIRFKPVGPLVEYHGRRQPCFCKIDEILASVKHKRPEFWEVLTDGGSLWNHAVERAAV